MERRFPIGAEVQPGGGVHFRVWAPESGSVAVELIGGGAVEGAHSLSPEGQGYYSGLVACVGPGALYKIRLESGSYSDPASRFQPEGPHGPSQVVEAASYKWRDEKWRGLPASELVIYEMHLGTFTTEGTWEAAAKQLKELRDLGVTMIEVMPIAEFPGRFGWGYDGVDLFAPTRLYGTPDDARTFVDAAHRARMMVILDVVYNHLGPDGDYLPFFAKNYFSKKYKCEWGDPLNFDGPDSGAVREFFISNARYWIEEFHFDGLRVDATQQVFDSSEPHILAEISRSAREAGKGREIFIVGENEPQEARLVRPVDSGGCGFDALWNDDFHHTAIVAATGKREAYYTDYKGTPQEFISAAKYGYLYQGQLYAWQKKRRGMPAFDLCAKNFVVFLQNHDQIANSLCGQRLHEISGKATLRALTAVTLLGPAIPMFFQGDEFAASTPFLYFADHNEELNKLVAKGRAEFLCQFRSIATPESRSLLKSPSDPETFRACKLDFSDRERNAEVYRLYRDLLKIRREDLTISAPELVDGAVLGEKAFVLRYFSTLGDDRILLVNLGQDLQLNPSPEPLLGPVDGKGWSVLWSSESPRYGGCGTPALETVANWMLPAYSAVLMKPDENDELATARLSQEN